MILMVVYVKVLFVVLILIVMIMMLTGISLLSGHGEDRFDDSGNEHLRRAVENRSNVITDDSIFSGFLIRSIRKSTRNHYSRRSRV